MDANQANKKGKRKTKNPLYVVTNKGQDVEQAEGVFDLWLKKLGLEPLMELLDFILMSLSSLVSSYPMFLVVKEVFDKYISQIEFFLSKLGLVPVTAYPEE